MNQASSSILLDIGGSYIKSAVFHNRELGLENVKRFTAPSFEIAGSLRKVIPTNALLSVVDEAIEAQKQYCTDAIQIFTSGQMGGYVIEQHGSYEIVSWQDERSLIPEASASYDSFRNDLLNSKSFWQTGSELRPGLPLVALTLNRRLFSEPVQRFPFRSVISFITSYLTGFENDTMHNTDASSSGFFNLQKQSWDLELTELVENSIIFPKTTTEVIEIGYSKKHCAKVFVGVGDQQASLFGAGLEPEQLAVNIGTGGQVAGITSQFEVSKYFRTRPFFDNSYIRTITHLPSGRALMAYVKYCLQKEILDDEDYSAFERLAMLSNAQYNVDIEQYETGLVSIANSSFHYDFPGIAHSFFDSLATHYVSAIEALKLPGDLLFAGGVGQKLKTISKQISKRTNRSYSVSASVETTLEGLSLIAQRFQEDN